MVAENAGRNATLAMEAQRGIAQVSGQVTAGALSAVTVHTQLSSSGNYSASAGTSVSYAVDGGEAAPPTLPYCSRFIRSPQPRAFSLAQTDGINRRKRPQAWRVAPCAGHRPSGGTAVAGSGRARHGCPS